MEEIKNKQSVYEKPQIQIIPLTETDIITSSGYPLNDCEGEIIRL